MILATLFLVLSEMAVKAAVVAAIGLGLRFALRRQSAARRHLVGVATVVMLSCVALSPLVGGLDPELARAWAAPPSVEPTTQHDFLLEAIGKRSVPPALPLSRPAQLAAAGMLIWMLVAGGLALRLGLGIIRALVFKSQSQPDAGRGAGRIQALLDRTVDEFGIGRPPRLVLCSRVRSPMAWGPPLARIVFPTAATGWNDTQLRMTLRHELGHIYRVDALSQALGHLMCAVFWFHPLVWWVQRSLLQDQEEACDDLVIEAGESPTTYARHILDTLEDNFYSPPVWAQLHDGGRSPLARRVRHLLASDARRQGVTRAVGAAVVALTVGGWTGVAALSSLSHSQTTGAATLNPSRAELLVEVMSAGLERDEIPGGVIALVQGSETILSRGVGLADRDRNVAADPTKTVFRIGSITKPITAIGLLKVLEQKGIPVDVAVQPYTDGLPVPSASGEPVTFRHLLTHTGGFDQLGYNRRADRAAGVLRLRAFLANNLVAQRPPGTLSTYDTYGISLAGLLIEQLSGMRYRDYIVKEVFRPLGMTSSGFGEPGSDGHLYATGYAGRGNEMRSTGWEYHHTVPASSANSTAADMTMLMKSLLNDCRIEGGQLLSVETCRAMLRQQFSNHPRLDGYGFGFITERREGRRVVQHGGSMDGFGALIYLLPDEKVGLFLAYNRETGSVGSAVSSELLTQFFPTSEETRLYPPYTGEIDISRYTGRWINTLRCHSCQGRTDFYWRAQPFEITASDDHTLVVGGGPTRAIGPQLFQRDDGLLVAFREDQTGRISHMFIRQTVYERPEAVPTPDSQAATRYVHPPCPRDCGEHHDRVEPEPAVCPSCGMNFVADVP